MPCPYCRSPRTQEQAKKTSLGYRTFRCAVCARRFNECTGTPFNDLSVPTDIVFLVVLWRLRYPLSLRHLAEMFLERSSPSATRRSALGKPRSRPYRPNGQASFLFVARDMRRCHSYRWSCVAYGAPVARVLA